MSSDSEQSSLQPSPPHSNLQHIWTNIQKTKTLSQLLDKTPQHHHQVQERYEPRYENRQNKENLAHLLKKVRAYEEQNGVLRSKLDVQRESRQIQFLSLQKEYQQKLRNQVRRMKITQKQNLSAQKDNNNVQIIHRQNQRLSLRIKAIQMEKHNLEAECSRLTHLNQIYVQKMAEGKQIEGHAATAEQLLELEEANQTILRLVELLRRTQQYRQYAPLMQEIGDMHYLKNILRRLKSNQLILKPINKKVCRCSCSTVSEKLVWSPIECYKIMLGMKMKYDYLNEDCIEEVLFEMNRIYNAREQKNIQKMKALHAQELHKLRKQIDMSYDQVLTKKQITRLKKELKGVKSAHKNRPLPNMNHLKDQGQLGDQLKLKQKEIKLLKERVQLFQSENGYQDKALYFQGTLYALDKILTELQSNEANMKQFEVKFRERVEDNIQPEQWLASYKDFFQTIEELNAGLVERVLGLKESVLLKMSQVE